MKKGGNGRPGQSHGNKVLVIRSASVHRAVNYNNNGLHLSPHINEAT